MKLLTSVSDELRSLVERDEFFWLDLEKPGRAEVDRLVDLVGLDPRAARHALEFGRTPEIRRYPKHVALVFYGVEGTDLLEVHIFVSGDWLITIRQKPSHALDDQREELSQGPPPAEGAVVARVLQALADDFDDLMDPIDDEIAAIEQQVVESEGRGSATRPIRQEILDSRSRLFRARRLARRQRDYIDRTITEIEDMPGLEPAQRHDLRDVSGQMIRVTDRIDDALDRLSAALDILNSMISNRMNAVMERLTVVATVFLPLTFLTGFFGMNFAWMVGEIDTPLAFWLLGVGLVIGSGIGVAIWVALGIERRRLD